MPKHCPQRDLHVQWGHLVTAKPVDWLWEPWLARGVVVVIDGDPGLGKSSLTLDLVARVSVGRPFPGPDDWPAAATNGEQAPSPILNANSQLGPGVPTRHPLCDGNPPPKRQYLKASPRYSLVVPLEDPIDSVVVPRLQAAGADMTQIAFLGGVRETYNDGQFDALMQLPRDLDLIRARVAELRPALLVIDPLFAVLGYDDEGRYIKASDDQSVRRLTGKLRKLAEEFNLTIVLVRHLNKAMGGTALHRGSGSIAIAGQARAVMLVGRDPNNPAGRVLAMTKCNLTAAPGSLRFRIIGAGASSRVEWQGETGVMADDLIQGGFERESMSHALECATFFLRCTLADGEATWTDLVRKAAEEDICEKTLRTARAKLKLDVRSDGKNRRLWDLPKLEKLLLYQR